MVNSKGFTLLEVMIAMAIMMVAFTAILMVESNSLNTSSRSKQMNLISMLAKNLISPAEFNQRKAQADEAATRFRVAQAEYDLLRSSIEIRYCDSSICFGDAKERNSCRCRSKAPAEHLRTIGRFNLNAK